MCATLCNQTALKTKGLRPSSFAVLASAASNQTALKTKGLRLDKNSLTVDQYSNQTALKTKGLRHINLFVGWDGGVTRQP